MLRTNDSLRTPKESPHADLVALIRRFDAHEEVRFGTYDIARALANAKNHDVPTRKYAVAVWTARRALARAQAALEAVEALEV